LPRQRRAPLHTSQSPPSPPPPPHRTAAVATGFWIPSTGRPRRPALARRRTTKGTTKAARAPVAAASGSPRAHGVLHAAQRAAEIVNISFVTRIDCYFIGCPCAFTAPQTPPSTSRTCTRASATQLYYNSLSASNDCLAPSNTPVRLSHAMTHLSMSVLPTEREILPRALSKSSCGVGCDA